MKSAYILVGVTFGIFRQILSENKKRWTVGIRSISRGIFIAFNALFASILSAREKRKYYKEIMKTTPVKAPIFIIGHWRTGSTFLHQLFKQDPELTTPTHYQVILPEFFISATPYYKPVLKVLTGKTRPMDSMKMGLDEPQEDEYALYKLTGISPLNQLMFPKDESYFLKDNADFIPEKHLLDKWQEAFNYFYRKITYVEKKQVVFKNPFHTLRIEMLLEMFPNAKFVHIYRHPHEVIPSTKKMWEIVGRQNSMNSIDHKPKVEDVAKLYNKMLVHVKSMEPTFRKGHFVNVYYDDLVKDTVNTMSSIYKNLELKFSEKYEQNLLNFISENSTHVKNSYAMSPEEMSIIDACCQNSKQLYKIL